MSTYSVCALMYTLTNRHDANAEEVGNLAICQSLRDIQQVSDKTDSRWDSSTPASILLRDIRL